MVDTLQGREAIQRELGRLERWVNEKPHDVQPVQVQGPETGLGQSQMQNTDLVKNGLRAALVERLGNVG